MTSILASQAACLGCLLVYAPKAAPYMTEHFHRGMFDGHHATVFDAGMKVWSDSQSGGQNAVAGELERQGQLEIIGGRQRLWELDMTAIPPILLPEYAKIFRDHLAKARLAKLLDALGEQLNSASGTQVGDVLAEGLAQLEAIANDRIEHSTPSMRALVGDAMRQIQDRVTGGTVGVSTGIPCLDRLTGGIRGGSQWVIAGPAKGGKSSLALTMMCSLAVEHGKRVALYGLEMPSVENVERMLCHDGRVSASATRDGKLSEWQLGALGGASLRIAAAPIHCRDDLFELSEIIASAKQIKLSFPDLFAIFVDYAQLVGAAVGKNDTREREVAAVSRGLRKFSMTTGIAVVLLSQTNDDGRLRESRTLGMDATKIVTIDFGEDAHSRKLKLTQRDGMSGVELPVRYDGEFFQFSDIANAPEI